MTSGALGPWLYVRDEKGMRWVESTDPTNAGCLTPSGSRRLVVGGMNDTLVVADDEQARTIASAWHALALAETIDEALDRLPEPYRSQVEELKLEAADEGFDEPGREALYDWAIEGGIEWLQQEMLTLLPDDLADSFGEQSFSGVSGPCLLIPAERRAELIQALRAEGFEVVEDDELVWAASAWGYDHA